MVISQDITKFRGEENIAGIKEDRNEEEDCVQGEINQEVLKCIDRSWLMISTQKKSLNEMKEIMEKLKRQVSSMVKWGSFGFVIICSNTDDAEKIERTKECINETFVKVERMTAEMVDEYKRFTWLE